MINAEGEPHGQGYYIDIYGYKRTFTVENGEKLGFGKKVILI